MCNIRSITAALFIVGGCAAPQAPSTTLIPPPVPVLPAPPPPWAVPRGIIGHMPAEVISQLGSPLEDHTSTNRVIDFKGRDCVLSVFFRDEADGWRAFDVLHILPSGDNVDPNPCYRSIIELKAAR